MTTKLYRSQTNKVVAGVCGGLGEYLNLDATWVRIFVVLLGLAGTGGLLLPVYMMLWVMLPYPGAGEAGAPETVRVGAEEIRERAHTLGDELRGAMCGENRQASLFVGGGLVFLGLVFLADTMHLWWLHWLNPEILWPILLIAAGAALIWRRMSEAQMASTGANTDDRS